MNWPKLLFWQKPAATSASPSYEVLGEYQSTESLEEDRLVVEALLKAGADLSQPREVLHYFYFSNEVNAESVAAELRRSGFVVEGPCQAGAAGETPNQWRVIAKTVTVVSLDSAYEHTSRFRALANQSRGEYDGWEAAATP